MCATTPNTNSITPYQMWYSMSLSLNLSHLFGTVVYLRRIKRGHKPAPRGETCLMMGIAQNHPSSTFRVPNVNIGLIAIRQNVSWNPETPEIRGDGNQVAASGGGAAALASRCHNLVPKLNGGNHSNVTDNTAAGVYGEDHGGATRAGSRGTRRNKDTNWCSRAATRSSRPRATTSRRSQLSHS